MTNESKMQHPCLKSSKHVATMKFSKLLTMKQLWVHISRITDAGLSDSITVHALLLGSNSRFKIQQPVVHPYLVYT